MKQYSYKNAPKTQKAKVQHLYVETDRSTGLLPDDVFEFTNLEILSVRLLKAIPPEISKLKKLRKLDITFWSGGALPDYIDALDQLEELGIRVVQDPLILPQTLANLKHLKKLACYDCKLEKIPTVLLKMPQLVRLELTANKGMNLDLTEKCHWPNLEILDLRTNAFEEIPKWIYRHQSLKELFLPNNNIQELPTSLNSLNKLEKLMVDNNKIEHIAADLTQFSELKRLNWFENPMGWIAPFVFQLEDRLLDFKLFWHRSSKQQVKDILSIRKALIKADLLENKLVVEAICLLLLEDEKAKEALANSSVLACYAVSNIKVREAVILEMTKRLNPFDPSSLTKGSELLVLGTTLRKKADLKARLIDLGIVLTNKRSTKTSHVILGKNIKKTADLLENGLILLTETALNHYLDEVAPAYLLEAEVPENTANLRDLLLTLSEENVSIALELLKSGGVPKGLMTTLFFVHKFSTNAKIVRISKSLLTLNASENLLEALKIRFNFKQDRVNFFEAKKYVTKVCFKTEIDAIELMKQAFTQYNNKYPFPSLYTEVIKELPEKEQKEAATEFWNGRVKEGKLMLQEGDGRIINHLFDLDIVEVLEGRHYPVTSLTSHRGGAKMKRLKTLILEYKREKIRLPKDFGTLENLEELVFINANFHEQGWNELENLKNLKKLTYQSDGEQIPTEIFNLSPLKILILDGKNMHLDLPIHQLQALEEVQVPHSSMEGAAMFVEALKKLPNLVKIQLHSALDALYRAH